MKYQNTIIHVIEDGCNDEFLIQIGYDEKTNSITPLRMKGNLKFVKKKNYIDIVHAAIIQNEYVAALDGEVYYDHIYFNINDYDKIIEIESKYFYSENDNESKKLLSNKK